MDPIQSLAPPPNNPNPAPPESGRLVTPEILFLNQGSTYRLGAAFSGTADPSTVWQQMIDNLPTAMMYYRELEAKDDDIADALAEMKQSVMQRGWQINPADDSAQAAAAADFIRQQLDALPNWRNSLYNMLDAPFYGYTVAEMIFDNSMGQASLQDVVDCPQELFCFAPVMYPQIGQLRLKAYASNYDGEIVPEQKFLTYTARSRHGNRMGMPILREIYWASWFKRNVQRFWLRLAERGPGTAVVVYADGADEDTKRQAVLAADALLNEVAIALPASFKVMEDLLKGTRTADPKTYESLYNILESKIYRRIVGSTLTSHGSDGGKGTQALGNVHAQTKEERSVELALQLGDVINRQLVRLLVLWNFGPDCPMPKFAFDVSDEADMGERVTTTDTLQSMGLPIPRKWTYQFFGIPEPAPDEDVLDRPVAQPAIAIATPAGTPARPQFSDAQQRQVDQDKDELDTLFTQLRGDVLRKTAEQVGAIAASVEHSQVGTRG
jgi:phage gp29-like protein